MLMDRSTGDGGESSEDSGSSQPYPSTLPGIPEAIFIYVFYMIVSYLNLHSLRPLIVMSIVSCRAVHDNYFNGCRDQWKRIHSKIISRKLL